MRKGKNRLFRACRVIAFSFLFFLPSLPVFAAELAPEGTPARKFQRGLLNVALSPIEISHELEKVKSQDKWFATWIPAAFQGTVGMTIRVLVGIYEIATFAVPSPPDYRPVLNPETPLGHLGNEGV
jgi:putative exosortase-associated protein (TIGR04073 family)